VISLKQSTPARNTNTRPGGSSSGFWRLTTASLASFQKVFAAARGNVASDRVKWMASSVFVHSARTALAAVASLLVARIFRLPEAYWAPTITLVIAQSALGAALKDSWQRFVGTALGATLGAIAAVASQFKPHVLVFVSCVFMLGLLCAVTRSDRSAYRMGGITLTIVLLVPRAGPAWQIALHRFAEVSIGIGVALIFAWIWPEKEVTAVGKR
jgi:uncharacterized membrane protein YccC